MKKIWTKITSLWAKVHWFRSPREVESGGILLFPRRLDLRHCGLAGILEVVEGKKFAEPSAETFSEVFSTLKECPLIDLIVDEDWEIQEKKIREAIEDLERITGEFKKIEGFEKIYLSRQWQRDLQKGVESLNEYIAIEEEKVFGGEREKLPSSRVEKINSILIDLKDLAWRIERELLVNIKRVDDLLCPALNSDENPSAKLLFELRKLNSIFNNLDRLEIRGRDSAGFSTFVTFPSVESRDEYLHSLSEEEKSELDRRSQIGDYRHLAIYSSKVAPTLAFTFKVAKEIGKLGDNVAYLRGEVKKDRLYQNLLSRGDVKTLTLAHTRWASNGIINIPNCHPVDNVAQHLPGEESGYDVAPLDSHPHYGEQGGYLNIVLNGDIDNFVSLRESLLQEKGTKISPNITTDAKVIPLQIEKYLLEGYDLKESFRRAVSDFKGSSAIAMQSDLEPGKVYLSLKGSGQSIYVGLGEDKYSFASEVYGLVEETRQYIKLNGEELASEKDPESHGQIFVLNRHSAGGLEGIEALFHNGQPVHLSSEDINRAEITTRDIDRRGYDHFFLKEISESPHSVSKTLRGKYHVEGEKVTFYLGEEILPQSLLEKLKGGDIRHIIVIGQGTAGIAGRSIAAFLKQDLADSEIVVQGMQASELSGFSLTDDMSDTLIVAVTQSGTTTDTNNAVELAKKRGAHTLAIVNRRNSDITFKVDGVFYTSDGRDVEMSVASTKAFYSQVMAGSLLSLRLARSLELLTDREIAAELEELSSLPQLMKRVLDEKKDQIAASARRYAPTRKYWAVVGSGLNNIAAKEVRIKLSELCYKSIACDFVEDKKHIDLSSEPLIIVCASGSHRSVLGDIIKDVSIFKAHKAAPIVFASEGTESFAEYAYTVIELPPTSAKLSLILNTLAGHIWGYYAALAIHEESELMAQIRSLVVDDISREGSDIISGLSMDTIQKLNELSNKFHDQKRQHRYQGSLKTETASDLALLFKYATNKLPLVDFQREFEKVPTAKNVIETLLQTLSRAVDELTRPIDAIKHQAKTVTVGTSRLELPGGPLFDVARDLKIGLEEIELDNLNYLKRIQPAISLAAGYTLYNIENLDSQGEPSAQTTIAIEDRGGLSETLSSRVATPSPLVGTKRSVVRSRRALATVGRSDRRPILLLPLVGKNYQVDKLLLFHLEFKDHLKLKMKKVLLGSEYEEIKNAVVEANLKWDDELLVEISPQILVTSTASEIAERIIQDVKVHE